MIAPRSVEIATLPYKRLINGFLARAIPAKKFAAEFASLYQKEPVELEHTNFHTIWEVATYSRFYLGEHCPWGEPPPTAAHLKEMAEECLRKIIIMEHERRIGDWIFSAFISGNKDALTANFAGNGKTPKYYISEEYGAIGFNETPLLALVSGNAQGERVDVSRLAREIVNGSKSSAVKFYWFIITKPMLRGLRVEDVREHDEWTTPNALVEQMERETWIQSATYSALGLIDHRKSRILVLEHYPCNSCEVKMYRRYSRR